jgi:hypothetical protein
MKNHLLVLLAVIVAFSFGCDSKKSKFSGVWMAYKVENMGLEYPAGTNIAGRPLMGFSGQLSQLDSFVKLEEDRVFCFESNGELLDDGEMFGQQVGKWELSAKEDKLVVKSVRGTETFDIFKIKERTIMLRKQYEKAKDSILYTLVPFENKDAEALKKAFRYLMQKPTQAETDEQIKERLRNALKFYGIYFQSINDDKIVNSFRPSRIYLPIDFYSGGIGIKTFNPNAEWVYLFNNVQDASKAYSFLILALKKVGVFPNHAGHFAQEYAEVLTEMSGNL